MCTAETRRTSSARGGGGRWPVGKFFCLRDEIGPFRRLNHRDVDAEGDRDPPATGGRDAGLVRRHEPFGGSDDANATPRLTHGPSRRLVFTASTSTITQPVIV